MSNLTKRESELLNGLNHNDYEIINNDTIHDIVSLLEKLEPDVAKALIEKMPDGIRGIAEIEGVYAGILSKGIDSIENGAKSCCSANNKLIDAAVEELHNADSLEEKMEWYDRAEDAVKRIEDKDSEHRRQVTDILKIGGAALAFGVCIVGGMFLGSSFNGKMNE